MALRPRLRGSDLRAQREQLHAGAFQRRTEDDGLASGATARGRLSGAGRQGSGGTCVDLLAETERRQRPDDYHIASAQQSGSMSSERRQSWSGSRDVDPPDSASRAVISLRSENALPRSFRSNAESRARGGRCAARRLKLRRILTQNRRHRFRGRSSWNTGAELGSAAPNGLIRSMVAGPATHLFWRHVTYCSQHGARIGVTADRRRHGRLLSRECQGLARQAEIRLRRPSVVTNRFSA